MSTSYKLEYKIQKEEERQEQTVSQGKSESATQKERRIRWAWQDKMSTNKYFGAISLKLYFRNRGIYVEDRLEKGICKTYNK